MHLLSVRSYGLAAFIVGTLSCAVLLAHMTSYFQTESYTVASFSTAIGDFERHKWKMYELADLFVDFEAHIDDTFTWAVKMIYAYIKASYTDDLGHTHEMIVWDRRISSKEDATLLVTFVNRDPTEIYPLRSLHVGELANKEVQLSLGFNVIPVGGLLRWDDLGTFVSKVLPAKYQNAATAMKEAAGMSM
ncbi:Signal peptidase 22kDa subunit [Carpediemonas membranifera]|uniref:Signal peptidase complex subunit 3 n=1 Tax=Carpediemonas membranifera TaxID=201153 RepID=A0A8J6AU32_9EUKA|nr:Signal peptidase 22kDa subunit [Carpediemonas membranifera]|eukprot:KAG9394711.1 Signal peptidase 22kDa subunit [Carpediemonas membranifera]